MEQYSREWPEGTIIFQCWYIYVFQHKNKERNSGRDFGDDFLCKLSRLNRHRKKEPWTAILSTEITSDGQEHQQKNTKRAHVLGLQRRGGGALFKREFHFFTGSWRLDRPRPNMLAHISAYFVRQFIYEPAHAKRVLSALHTELRKTRLKLHFKFMAYWATKGILEWRQHIIQIFWRKWGQNIILWTKCVQKCLLWMNLEWLRRLLHFPMDEHYRYGCWGHTPAILFRICFDLHHKHDSREANEYSKVIILLKWSTLSAYVEHILAYFGISFCISC